MGSAPFCQLLGQLRGAAPALADDLPTLHALAQLAIELQPAERRNGGAGRAGNDPGDAEVWGAGCSACPAAWASSSWRLCADGQGAGLVGARMLCCSFGIRAQRLWLEHLCWSVMQAGSCIMAQMR